MPIAHELLNGVKCEEIKDVSMATIVTIFSVAYFCLSSEVVKNAVKGASNAAMIAYHTIDYIILFAIAFIFMRKIDSARRPVAKITVRPARAYLRGFANVWLSSWPLVIGLVTEQWFSCLLNIIIDASGDPTKAHGINFAISLVLLFGAGYFFGQDLHADKEAEVEECTMEHDADAYGLLAENVEEENNVI